jgi:hypothetical protein
VGLYLLAGDLNAWLATGIFLISVASILDMALQWYQEGPCKKLQIGEITDRKKKKE